MKLFDSNLNNSDARYASKSAAIAAFILSGLSLILVNLAIYYKWNNSLSIFDNPVNLIDILFLALCGIGVLYYSRFAAVALFAYFLVSKIYISIALGLNPNLLVGVIFLYFFWRGVQGTFSYNRLVNNTEAGNKSFSKWWIILWSLITILAIIFVVYGIMIEVGFS